MGDSKISMKLRLLLSPYIGRLMEFYEYDKDNMNALHQSLRHIEIIRTQLEAQAQVTEGLTEYDHMFLASVISDSFYFEKKTDETLEFRVHFVRATWDRLLKEIGILIDDSKLIVVKNAYANSSQMVDGRTIYKKYDK